MTQEEFPPRRLDQDESKPPNIKVEQDQFQVTAFCPIPVKCEEDEEEPQCSEFDHSQTLGGKERGASDSDQDTSNKIRDFSKSDQCKSSRETQSGSNLLVNNDCNLSERSFSCSVCGKGFSQNSNLKTHMKIHTGEKPFICSICNKRFTQKVNMKSHMACHTREKQFRCKTCDKTFHWFYQLKNHQCFSAELHQTADKREADKPMETAADGDAQPAEQDGYLQPRTEDETSRSTAFQTNRRVFSCPDCSKTFIHKGHLWEHVQCHTGDKPLRCSVCNRGFLRRRHLQRHVQTHAGESVAIIPGVSRESLQPDQSQTQPRSDGGFLTRSAGDVGRRAKKQFPCSQCGKVFSFKDSLVRHTRCHTGEKPFSCPTCGKRFRDRGNMKQHVVIHTGEKRFICSVCNRGFCWWKQLKRHKCDAVSSSILHTS